MSTTLGVLPPGWSTIALKLPNCGSPLSTQVCQYTSQMLVQANALPWADPLKQYPKERFLFVMSSPREGRPFPSVVKYSCQKELYMVPS